MFSGLGGVESVGVGVRGGYIRVGLIEFVCRPCMFGGGGCAAV